MYPSFFQEFTGPLYNLPWFRLTPEAIEIDREERKVYEEFRYELRERLRRFISMSTQRVLPLKIVKGMEWYLGLPSDFLDHLDSGFRFVEMEDGVKGLAVEGGEDRVLSVLQRNAMKKGVYSGEPNEAIEFPLFPSKGLRLRTKIENWLQEFQRLPYASPYEDYSNLNPDSDLAEKRVVGFLHELLSLFVEHSAERKKLLCLKKHFGLPQKVHKAFERHPHVFYLSLKNKTCTAILKEAFRSNEIPKHPLSSVRCRYIKLLKDSDRILKSRRISNRSVNQSYKGKDLDSDYEEENRVGV